MSEAVIFFFKVLDISVSPGIARRPWALYLQERLGVEHHFDAQGRLWASGHFGVSKQTTFPPSMWSP